MSKYTIFFEKFANRKLARWERDIIAPLEYTRQHGSNHRIVIVDPPGYDSRKLLCEYFSFLHRCIDSYGNFLVMAKTKRDAATISGYLSRAKTPWLTTASGHHPDNIRGLTFNYALLLDCQAYNSKTPKSSRSANNSKFNLQHSKQGQKQLHHHPHPQRIQNSKFHIRHCRRSSAHLHPRPVRSAAQSSSKNTRSESLLSNP